MLMMLLIVSIGDAIISEIVFGKVLRGSIPGGYENLKLAGAPAVADKLSGSAYN